MDKLLIIDDSIFIGNVIKKILNDDIDVHYESEPTNSIELIRNFCPDLILLDVMMPNIDGFELNAEIKKHSDLENIPVIFITSSNDDKTIEKCFNEGAVDYIKKPFNNVELKHRVLMHIKNYKVDRKLSKAMDRLHKIAHTDILTNLYNRRYFLNSMENMENMADTVFVLSDIDNFKLINDTYGHDGGDYVLKKVSHILKTKIKEPNVIARWGGEEFIAFIRNTTIKDALTLIEDVRQCMENEYYKVNDVEFKVTSSFGLCKVGKLTIKEAMQFADKALYKSKMNGKNMCTVWDTDKKQN